MQSNFGNNAKGYLLAVSDYGGEALHVERDDSLFVFEDDEAAAKAAENDGIKLIKDLPLEPGDEDYAFYIDTIENRERLSKYLAKDRGIHWK